jgi:Dolichyl-phosphate-mannose-protein mannosyltransferase
MRAVYAVAAAAFLGRLALFAGLELYADEAYYWTWSLRPAFGYFDHPPMVAYLAWLGGWLPGELGLRVPFALCGALVVVFAAYAARALTDRPQAPLAAALLAATMPMLTLGGALALPDAPLEAAFAAATWLLLRARGRAWLLVGVAAGVALLSKYSAGLFAVSVLLAALFEPALRAELRTRWPWLGAVVATLIFAPCLAWNAAHGFVSLGFQLSHAVGGRRGGAFPEFLGAVIAGVGPVVLATAAVFLARTPTGPARRLLAVSAVPLAVTGAIALGSRVHANWPVLVYPGLCAAAGAFAATLTARSARMVVGASVVLGIGLAVVYGVELRVPRLFRPNASPIEQFHGWREALPAVRRAMGEPVPFVAPSNYQVAAQLAYYGGFRRFGPTFSRRSQFDVWNDAPAAGERVAMVGLRPPKPHVTEKIFGGAAAPAARVDAYFAGARLRTIWIITAAAGPSSPSPRVALGHRVIPDPTDEHSCQAGERPLRAALEQIGGDADVRHCADAAHAHERGETAQPGPALQAPIAIGEDVVQREVADHRRGGGDRLGRHEARVERLQRRGQGRHVDQHPEAPDDRIREEPHRHPASHQLVGE